MSLALPWISSLSLWSASEFKRVGGMNDETDCIVESIETVGKTSVEVKLFTALYRIARELDASASEDLTW